MSEQKPAISFSAVWVPFSPTRFLVDTAWQYGVTESKVEKFTGLIGGEGGGCWGESGVGVQGVKGVGCVPSLDSILSFVSWREYQRGRSKDNPRVGLVFATSEQMCGTCTGWAGGWAPTRGVRLATLAPFLTWLLAYFWELGTERQNRPFISLPTSGFLDVSQRRQESHGRWRGQGWLDLGVSIEARGRQGENSSLQPPKGGHVGSPSLALPWKQERRGPATSKLCKEQQPPRGK